MITVTKVKALNQLAFDAADLDAAIETKVQTFVSKVTAQRKKVTFLLKKANTLAESPEGLQLLLDELDKLTLYSETLQALLDFYEEKLHDKFTLWDRFIKVEQAAIDLREKMHLRAQAVEAQIKDEDADVIDEDDISVGYPEDRVSVKKGAK